jgi:hypothetical protein
MSTCCVATHTIPRNEIEKLSNEFILDRGFRLGDYEKFSIVDPAQYKKSLEIIKTDGNIIVSLNDLKKTFQRKYIPEIMSNLTRLIHPNLKLFLKNRDDSLKNKYVSV